MPKGCPYTIFMFIVTPGCFYKSLAERINNTKVSKIIIPFFGLSNISDEIKEAKGAFNQTVGGIRNIKKYALR